jgi:hypothetical protein
MRLRPLQGSTQRGPPTSMLSLLRRATKPAQLATLMEFLPLRRLSPSESTPRRLATPTTFRPQGFAPSRRLFPRSNARPCFMPVTSMGFHSPGAFPRCQVHPARHPMDYPLDVLSSALLSKLRNVEAPASPQTQSRAYVTSLFAPPGLCSDSESVPPLDCYIRCMRPIPS